MTMDSILGAIAGTSNSTVFYRSVKITTGRVPSIPIQEFSVPISESTQVVEKMLQSLDFLLSLSNAELFRTLFGYKISDITSNEVKLLSIGASVTFDPKAILPKIAIFFNGFGNGEIVDFWISIGLSSVFVSVGLYTKYESKLAYYSLECLKPLIGADQENAIKSVTSNLRDSI